MGRAIDMETNIDILKQKVKKLEDTVRGMVSKIDGVEDGLDDLFEMHDDVELTEVKDEKKKTNNEGDGKSSKSNNKSRGKSKTKAK